MTRRAGLALAIGFALTAAGCASSQSRMHRALDPSMERVMRTESYLWTVSGISGFPGRLVRGDGKVYLADVAPQLRYLASTGDTARFLQLRTFVYGKMVRRDSTGLSPLRAYRDGAPFEPATQYGVKWLSKALMDGWTQMGDTLSAMMLAQLRMDDATTPPHATQMYLLTIACGDAMDVVSVDPQPAREVLARAKRLFRTGEAEAEQRAVGITEAEGEVDLLSCLTRVGLALEDPDVTVRYLDHMLGHLSPLVSHSGRPDLGTTADVLLTLHRVRKAGPQYYDPGYYEKKAAKRP